MKFRLLVVFGIVLLCLGGSAGALSAEAQTARTRFTPPVVPETQTNPVRFEATVSGSPSSVVFNYNNVDRPMFDNGTNGVLVAGDGTWTILFTPAEILSKNTAVRVFRPFIGTCKPAAGGAFNVVTEQTIVTDFDEARWEHVLEEAASELCRGEGALLNLLGGGLFIGESNLAMMQFKEAVVTEGDAKDVRGEIFESLRAGADGFGMDHPIWAPNSSRH